MLRDGRFVVFGGTIASNAIITSCAVLTLDADGESWDVLRQCTRRGVSSPVRQLAGA